MMSPSIPKLILASLLFSLSIAAPADTATATPALPASCYTTIPSEHTVETHKCYTLTTVIPPTTCPVLPCPTPHGMCPQDVVVSSRTVPCSTDCCPTTSTISEPSGPCPTCEACPLPTVWVTYITGCPGTPTITLYPNSTPDV
ncbi:hypothetical protein GGS21DRAFT_310040 [Xylaria nigripes]|nr:hypothetical protein GGS21DRAFT_310040 [Xylaria nigripes]